MAAQITSILFGGGRAPPQKKETHLKKNKNGKTKNIGKTRGQIKNNGKTKHKPIFRDSSLKHPLSKEFVCFMCFPFFSFFFPMFFVFLPNYFGFSYVFFVCPRVFWFIFVPVFSCLLHRSVYRICRGHFFPSKKRHQRKKQYCIFSRKLA